MRVSNALLALEISLAGLLLGGPVGCANSQPAGPPLIESCVECITARRTNAYCETCGHGHVAGWILPSRSFHEALDAHGHDIDPQQIICLECAEVIETDGFCRRCRMGYVDEQLYFTELTWSLHRGRVRLAEELECRGCREAHGGLGACGRCGTLWAGNVAFGDRELHAIAVRQLRRLSIALERLPECEMCALAGFFGKTCPTCGSSPIPEQPAAERGSRSPGER